jgi:2-dehydro-3-deoxyphosphogluconate aldolase/(4S)-4-hydroxy-2-oxoglutarate aldolase
VIDPLRHCEERSDEAIQRNAGIVLDCFVAALLAMTGLAETSIMKFASENLLNRLKPLGVLPVVTVSGAEAGVALARALAAGGIPAIEVTLRVDGAMEALKAIAREVPEMLLGAGTVRSARQAEESMVAGASFLVSPGLVAEVAGFARRTRIAYLPGVATPTEMEMARAEGMSFLKLFPAEVVGGRAMLSAVGAAMPDFQFVPTGGVKLETMDAYLALPNVVAVGGSWIASNADIAAGNWAAITANARAAREKAMAARAR